MKLSIYNIHNISGDQFCDVEARSQKEALAIGREAISRRGTMLPRALRATKLDKDSIVSKDCIWHTLRAL